jgi:hypothetical protein
MGWTDDDDYGMDWDYPDNCFDGYGWEGKRIGCDDESARQERRDKIRKQLNQQINNELMSCFNYYIGEISGEMAEMSFFQDDSF